MNCYDSIYKKQMNHCENEWRYYTFSIFGLEKIASCFFEYYHSIIKKKRERK